MHTPIFAIHPYNLINVTLIYTNCTIVKLDSSSSSITYVISATVNTKSNHQSSAIVILWL